MDKGDVKRLWTLLSELYPRQKQSETESRLLAWELALEPYGYADVRAAALEHARACQYYPSVAELTARLQTPGHDPDAWMDKYVAKVDERIDDLGGACGILLRHGGVAGETIRRYAPVECLGCQRERMSGCLFVERGA